MVEVMTGQYLEKLKSRANELEENASSSSDSRTRRKTKKSVSKWFSRNQVCAYSPSCFHFKYFQRES